MVKTKKIELFYADWCGHCQTFKPVWKKLKEELDKHKISHGEYESAKIPKENFSQDVLDKIKGYPTMLITTNDGEKKEYDGARTFNDILEALGVSGTQSGGNSNYYQKYLKYKKKYIELQNKLNNL